MKRLMIVCGLASMIAVPASAQQLTLEIGDGRVTLEATNVPARQILAEWARLGGTTVVGAEKITGAPLTLKLSNVPERQALDIILRNVAGFIAAPRQASAATGASTYDKILIMATSASAAQAAANTPSPRSGFAAGRNAGTQRRVPPRPPNLPPSPATDDDDDADEIDAVADDAGDSGLPQPVFTFPAPAQGNNVPVFAPMQQQGGFGVQVVPGQPGAQTGQPVIQLQPGENGPTIYNFVPQNQPPGSQPTFGVVGSPTPGMIQVPQPQPVQPGAQVPPRRPPGR